MTQQDALQTLINAVNVAQKRGAFNLEEATGIYSAIMVFAASQPESSEGSSEKPTKKKEEAT